MAGNSKPTSAAASSLILAKVFDKIYPRIYQKHYQRRVGYCLTETSTAVRCKVALKTLQYNDHAPVSNSVLLRHAYVIMRMGPITGSNSPARMSTQEDTCANDLPALLKPIASSPNQISSIHHAIVLNDGVLSTGNA